VAEAWEQFGNPEDRERLLLEAVTSRLVKTADLNVDCRSMNCCCYL
jgi:hypothetical protein